jgi:predicted nucleotidyltransferase
MKRQQANLAIIELAAVSLEPLLPELALVGGCAVGLLVTDETRPEVRATIDVDLVAEVTTYTGYALLSDKLRDLGFRDSGDLNCRFRKGALIIDVVPIEESILGFGNPWFEQGARSAVDFVLPSGRTIRHVTAPYLLATKLGAFGGRGNGDYMHHDVEDIVNLLDGRPTVVDEVVAVGGDVREYIQDQFDALLADRAFGDSIQAHFHPTEDHALRVPLVLERMRRLAGL